MYGERSSSGAAVFLSPDALACLVPQASFQIEVCLFIHITS